MAQSTVDPFSSALRPGRSRAPGLRRALGNRIYRTNEATGNLELGTDQLEPGSPPADQGAATRSETGESTSPLTNVYAFDIPEAQVARSPSLGRSLAALAGGALAKEAIGAGVKKVGGMIGSAAARMRGYPGRPLEGELDKEIPGFVDKAENPTYQADDLRAEALRDAGVIDAEGFDTGPALQEGVDVIGAADLGDAGALADLGFAGDLFGDALDAADAANLAELEAGDLWSGGEEFAGFGDATGGVPVIGPAISLAQGDVEGAAGSAAGGAIGGAVGGPAGAVIGSVVGGWLVRNEGFEFVNQVVDDTGHIIGEVAADGVSVVNHAGDVIGEAAGGLARAVGDVAGGIGSFVKDIPIIGSFFGGGGGCYLTEAVAAGGGADNAPELETLRWFRDSVLTQTPEGQELIAEYEQAAPAIVEAISQRPDGQKILQGILTGYIQPAVDAVRRGEFDEALRIYAEMSAEVSELAIEITEDPQLEQLLEEFAQEAAEVAHDGEMAGVATATGTEMMHPGDQMGQQMMGQQRSRPMPNQPMSKLGRIYAGG